MDRRRYLRLLAAGASAAVAGCGGAPEPPRDRGGTGAGTRTRNGSPAAGDGLPVPRSELTRGAPKNAIPAIVDPAFADDWSGVRVSYYHLRRSRTVTTAFRLDDGDQVIGVTRDGRARAYPLRVLRWHEVVNDTFGGPQLVSYCPLCRTGVVADRLVNGDPTVFGVSGLLYRSNLVMYDRATESLWSQVRALAIRGPETGTRLSLRPSALTTWGEWRAAHPDTEVLLPPPESSTVRGRDATRDYSRNPYAGYEERAGVGGDPEGTADGRLHPKTLVVGIAHGEQVRAYPLPAVGEAGGLVNDVVGDLPVVVVVTGGESMAAYVRRVDGAAPRFERVGDGRIQGAGSTWDPTTGEALDGPHEGTTLDRANDRSPMYWFTWADLHPGTGVYGGTRGE